MGLELLLCCVLAFVERSFGLYEPIGVQLVHDLEGLHHFDGADFAPLQFLGEIVADEQHALIQLLAFLRLLEDNRVELPVSFTEDIPPPSLDDPCLASHVTLHDLHVGAIVSLLLIFGTQLLVLVVVD